MPGTPAPDRRGRRARRGGPRGGRAHDRLPGPGRPRRRPRLRGGFGAPGRYGAVAAALAAATCFANPAGGCATVPAATGVAENYITANGWTYDGSTVSVDTAAQTATIKLPARSAPTFFAGILGSRNATVASSARATWAKSAPVTCVLCVLGNFQGQVGDITLGGTLAVNGALTFNNAGGTVTVTGPGQVTYRGSWNNNGTFTANGAGTIPVQLAAPFPDPYAGLVLAPVNNPVIGDSVTLAGPAANGSGACAPGLYTDLSGCSSLTGNGIYVVIGTGSGDTAVTVPGGTAPNTLIYLTCGQKSGPTVTYVPCSSSPNGAYLGGAGNTDSVVQGRTQGAYRGFAVIYDRDRVVDQKLAGNAQLTLSGNFYGAGVTMDFRGNGNGSIIAGGNVVTGGVILKGNGNQKEHMEVPAGANPPEFVAAGTPVHLIP